MTYCDVFIEHSFLHNQTLTYSVGSFHVEFGMRVWVSVRKRPMIAFVSRVHNEAPVDFEALAIEGVVDDHPVLGEEMFHLAQWMAYNTVSPVIKCLQTILPNKLRPSHASKKPKLERYLVKIQGVTESLTPKQASFLEKIDEEIDYTQARKLYSGVRSLIDKGYLKEHYREASHKVRPISVSSDDLVMSVAQSDALAQIQIELFKIYLLFGVTGSGKTEVYLQKAREVLAKKQQVLIMVPEISLTPQMIERVSSRFGSDVAIYHSGLNEQEKYEQYQRVKQEEVSIVVGTRSSVFLPFRNLGLIVVDEEHDASYKQNSVPCYHARDIAIERAKFHACPVVLGSASPALESFARALKGNYQLLELDGRINDAFPDVTLVDMRSELIQGGSAVLSKTLKTAIQKRLDKKEQIVLLLNRRGYHTYLKNVKTQGALVCPYCDVALNYHKETQCIKCHICSYTSFDLPIIDGKTVEVVGMGVGTQRLVSILHESFKNVKILRMDADSTSTKGSHAKILNAFENHEADILVGTQMIAKGLDFENVTLVGIINADSSLMNTDYRAVENSFSLLLQAAGRSGRGSKLGEVVIQTQNTQHYAIVYAKNHNYKAFFKQEMTYRHVAKYPPYSYLISIVFQERDPNKCEMAANLFKSLYDHKDVQVIGPKALRKLKSIHRQRIILKGHDLGQMIASVHQVITMYYKQNRTGVVVDVNPLTLE